MAVVASRSIGAKAAVLLLMVACRSEPLTTFDHVIAAQKVIADVGRHLNSASDATDRAVIADSDQLAASQAKMAKQHLIALDNEVKDLRLAIEAVKDEEASRLISVLQTRLESFRELEERILDLSIESTNLKAQRLSFGPAHEAADAMEEALNFTIQESTPRTVCKSQQLVATAVLAVRKIQVLHAPHIAEPSDEVMSQFEAQVNTLADTANSALHSLQVVLPTSHAVTQAFEAFKRFQAVSTELISLSRRNSNVRSVSLVLREKPMLAGACDETLQALQKVLMKRLPLNTR